MQNFKYFRTSEITESFHYLAQTEGAKEYNDWDNHEIVKGAIEVLYYRCNELTSTQYSLIVNAFNILKIKDQESWNHAARLFMKHHPSLQDENFAYVF